MLLEKHIIQTVTSKTACDRDGKVTSAGLSASGAQYGSQHILRQNKHIGIERGITLLIRFSFARSARINLRLAQAKVYVAITCAEHLRPGYI